jgi:hypothetical protein
MACVLQDSNSASKEEGDVGCLLMNFNVRNAANDLSSLIVSQIMSGQ